MQDQHRFNTRAWLLWTAGFVAFIVGGVLAMAATGRINDAGSALLGGMIAGAVIGTGQWLVGRRLLGEPQAWIGATALAMGLGLLVGAWAVGYGTSLGELALMGAITGIPIGAAQAYLLRDRLANAWVWAAAMPLLWALGWTVTTAGGIDVDRQFAVFGAYGAIRASLVRRCQPVTDRKPQCHDCKPRRLAHGHVRPRPFSRCSAVGLQPS